MRVFASLLLLLSTATAGAQSSADAEERRSPPLGLDAYMPIPEDNPLTPEKIALGRRLFSDRLLARDGTKACRSCHEPERAFTDGRPVAVGVRGQTGERSAPTLVNRGYGRSFFWDGRAPTLEVQVLEPIVNPKELDLAIDEAVRRLARTRDYRRQFQTAFGRPVNAEDLARSLASYVRSILSGNAPLDRYMSGDRDALSPQAREGLGIFRGKGNCTACHVGPTLTDEQFHNTGVAWKDPSTLRPFDKLRVVPSPVEGRPGQGRPVLRQAQDALSLSKGEPSRGATASTGSGQASAGQTGAFQDLGRFAVTGRPEDQGAFKTPTLREIARTAPYMHDGSFITLGEVLEFYNRGGNANPFRDRELHPLGLSEEEKQALLAFLRSLTGDIYEGRRAGVIDPK